MDVDFPDHDRTTRARWTWPGPGSLTARIPKSALASHCGAPGAGIAQMRQRIAELNAAEGGSQPAGPQELSSKNGHQ